MKLAINYATDTLTLAPGVQVPFDSMRKYLLSNHAELCQRNFIKAIKTMSGTLFTYDWENIFNIASNTSIIYDFCKQFNIQPSFVSEPRPVNTPIRKQENQLQLFWHSSNYTKQ